jgi:uncharacterized membrane protein
MEEKNLQLERTVFFCDAVVAIAITLLALEIKIPPTENGHLTFEDVWKEWRAFAAFFLSFLNIANFWRTHHSFFSHIKKVDERMVWFNIGWLLFIVLLPFSTSLVSNFFNDKPSALIYSANFLVIAIFQNMIWDYAVLRKDFLKHDGLDDATVRRYRVFCNLDMINALIALVVAIFRPGLAFILLFTKLPVFVILTVFYKRMFAHGKR